MNTKQQLHQLKLQQWAEQFRWLMQGFSIEPVIHDVYPKHSA